MIDRTHAPSPDAAESANATVLSVRFPELPLALFALLLHFPWEMLQSPLWVGMANLAHAEGVRVCTIAALGDVVIALAAFWSGSLAARSRLWLLDPPRAAFIAYMLAGLVLTIAYEFAATGPLVFWEYAPSQPRLPILGTGLAPVLQWLLLPPFTLWLARIHVLGRTSDRSTYARASAKR
jgi:hypothetical protein